MNTIKTDNSIINKNELNEFIFNSVLKDIHLSKYSTDKIFNLVDVDIIPESYTFYGEDSKEIEDADIDNDELLKIENGNEFKKVNLKYNKELSSDIWSHIMIYGGLNLYHELLNNIIEDVKEINEDVAKKMMY